MARTIAAIIGDIDEFLPRDGEWKRLDRLLDELFGSDQPQLGIVPLLRVFERFPEEDGYGVFWSIVHGLESLPGYEKPLLASINRKPTEFTVLMVNRMLNSGITEVEGVSLLTLLARVSSDSRATKGIKKDAERFLIHQRTKSNPGEAG